MADLKELCDFLQDRIKERDRDIWLARTQTSAVSDHAHAHDTGHYPLWDEVKFIDRDPHWYTRRVKEAIHIRLHPDSINRDSGIEISEAWMPTISRNTTTGELQKSGPLREQKTGKVKIETHQSQLLKINQSPLSIILYKVSRKQSTSSPTSTQSKRRDLRPKVTTS